MNVSDEVLEKMQKCCAQRGARMQILRDYVLRGTDRHPLTEAEYAEMDCWFNEDGSPT